MYRFMSFLCGLIFGLGLTISNMTNPNKVLNFLDITGNWDPTLLVVMASALIVTFIGYKIVRKLEKPRFALRFYTPEKTQIEGKLVIGSAIFGIGWGLAGYCPGPAVTALSTFNTDPLYLFIGLILGSFAFYKLFGR